MWKSAYSVADRSNDDAHSGPVLPFSSVDSSDTSTDRNNVVLLMMLPGTIELVCETYTCVQ